jgi:hypothetical protein
VSALSVVETDWDGSMKRWLAVVGVVAGLLGPAGALAADADDAVKAACSVAFQKYCPNADGEKAYRHCARMHFFRLSRECRHVLLHYRSDSNSEAQQR